MYGESKEAAVPVSWPLVSLLQGQVVGTAEGSVEEDWKLCSKVGVQWFPVRGTASGLTVLFCKSESP